MKTETERDGPDVDPVSSKSAVTGFGSDISMSSVTEGHKDVEPRRSTRKRIAKRFADWSDTDENSLSGSRDKDRKRIRKEKLHSNNTDTIENGKNTGTSDDHGNEQSADLLLNVKNCVNEQRLSETTPVCDDGDNNGDDIDQCKKRQECVTTDSDTDRKTEPVSSDTEVEIPANAVVKSRLKRAKKRKVNSRVLSFEHDKNSEDNNGKMSKKRNSASREHRCEVCDKVMLRSADLAKHMLVHSGEKPYECDVCGKRFSQAGNMKEHKRTHTGERPFKCEEPECKKAFIRASDLRAHKVTHSTGKPFSCDECSKSFASIEYLKSHRILHSQERPFSCDECGMSFHKAATLRNHAVTHNNVKRYPCDLCSKAFHTLGNLKDHQSVHTGDRPYSCDVCQKTFTKKCSVKKHMILHADQRPFSCSQCGKGYATKAELEIHTRTHTGERPFKCHHCSADFHRKANLNLHISSVHLHIRQYVCEICGKAFAESRSLREHQLIHSGEKPHECDTCGKAFTQSSSLKAHVRSHSGEKPYKCKFCPKAFTHLSTRNRHIRLHTGEKPYKCCLCSAEFARLDVLKEHKRVEHDFDKAERNKTVNSRLAGDHSYDIPKDPAVLVLPSVKEDQPLQVVREDQPLIGSREDQPLLVTGEEQSSLDVKGDQPLQVVRENQPLQPLVAVEQCSQVVKNEASDEQFVVSIRDGNLIITNAAGEYAVDISSMVSSADSGIQLAVDGTCVIASDSHVESADHVLKSDTSELSYLKLQLVDGDTTRSLFLDTRTFSSDTVSVPANVGSPETAASFASVEEGACQQIVFKDAGVPEPDVIKSKRDTEYVETEAGLDEHKYGENSAIMESHIGQHCEEMSDSVVIEAQVNQCDNGSKTVEIEVADDHMSRLGTMEIHNNEEDPVATGIEDNNLASAVVGGQVLHTHDGHQGGLIAEPSDSPSENEKETNFLIVQQDNDSQSGHIVTRLANENETNNLVQLSGNQLDNGIKIVILEGDHFDNALEPEAGELQGNQLQSYELCTGDTESQQVYHLNNLSASDLAQLLNGLGDAQSIQQVDFESQGEENKGLLTSAGPQSHIDQNGEIQPDNSEGTGTTPNNEHSYFFEDENRQPGIISVVKAHPQDSMTAKSSTTPPQATILRDLLTHILPLDSTTAKMVTSSSMHSPQKPSDGHGVDTKITVEGLRQKKRRYGALPKSFFCDMCGKGFTQASSLNKHQVLLHSKDKPFVCSQCQKVCYCKSDLEAHMRIHSGERPFKCPQCDALLKRKANLEQHISAVHMRQRPHICDICGRGFTEARSLKDHKLIHMGTKPHGCQRCGKAFTQLSTLKKHEQTHTRVEKPFVCSYCGNSFTENQALQRHLRKHIGDSVNTFRCQLTSTDVQSPPQNS